MRHFAGVENPDRFNTEPAAFVKECFNVSAMTESDPDEFNAFERRGHELEDDDGAHTVRSADALAPTFEAFAKEWTDGDLHRKYPDHVKDKRTAYRDAELLRLHILPIVKHIRLPDFRLADAEDVMAKVPSGLAAATRRHVAQVMSRLMRLAVYPGKWIAHSPIPRGWLPRVGDPKAKEGKTETWVSDRTGHRSHEMIETYRRRARTWNLGELGPLCDLLPELRKALDSKPEGKDWAADATIEWAANGQQHHRTGGETGRRSGFRFRRRKA